MESDPFDDILGLEDKFYNEGLQLGAADGAKVGRIEGRVFGLEKGFEKYVEMGRLHGRSLVWSGRLPKPQLPATEGALSAASIDKEQKITVADKASSSSSLPTLPENPRLEKHLKVLYALTEPASLSTENTEDAVSDFDDRLKRALGKIKIVEKLVGEEGAIFGGGLGTGGASTSQQAASDRGDGSIEDMSVLKARR